MRVDRVNFELAPINSLPSRKTKGTWLPRAHGNFNFFFKDGPLAPPEFLYIKTPKNFSNHSRKKRLEEKVSNAQKDRSRLLIFEPPLSESPFFGQLERVRGTC